MVSNSEKITPRNFTEEMFDDARIRDLGDFLDLVKKGEPWRISTERLLRLRGNVKRGRRVNAAINSELRNRGLICTPDIENADYYGDVTVSDPRDTVEGPGRNAALPLSALSGGDLGLVSVGPETTALKVQTIMIRDDLSQIPVLSNDKKTLRGVVTWQSIALFRGDITKATASEVMADEGHVASSSDDFLDHVQAIIEKEYVLYRIPNGEIDGIVTASDLAQTFDDTTGLYIKLQEIETRIRIVLDRSTIPQLQQSLEPRRRAMKKFRGAADMAFGEYLNALRDPEVWAAGMIEYDQEMFLNLLEQVRDIRNDAMHFRGKPQDDPDAVAADGGSDPATGTIERALRLLRKVPLG